MSEDVNLRNLVAEVAAAYFSNSHVTPTEIPTVIGHITSSLSGVGAPVDEAALDEPAQTKLTPAQIRKSITRDALISFEDGKPYKTLRRHLAVKDLTPEQYREKWGLPKDYPMVAPAYSEARSNMAKALGLGSRRGQARPAAQSAPAAAPAQAAPAKSASPKVRRTSSKGSRRSKPTATGGKEA